MFGFRNYFLNREINNDQRNLKYSTEGIEFFMGKRNAGSIPVRNALFL